MSLPYRLHLGIIESLDTFLELIPGLVDIIAAFI
jgi:hypothetical protein